MAKAKKNAAIKDKREVYLAEMQINLCKSMKWVEIWRTKTLAAFFAETLESRGCGASKKSKWIKWIKYRWVSVVKGAINGDNGRREGCQDSTVSFHPLLLRPKYSLDLNSFPLQLNIWPPSNFVWLTREINGWETQLEWLLKPYTVRNCWYQDFFPESLKDRESTKKGTFSQETILQIWWTIVIETYKCSTWFCLRKYVGGKFECKIHEDSSLRLGLCNLDINLGGGGGEELRMHPGKSKCTALRFLSTLKWGV